MEKGGNCTPVGKLAAEPRRHRGKFDGAEVLRCVDVLNNCVGCVTPRQRLTGQDAAREHEKLTVNLQGLAKLRKAHVVLHDCRCRRGSQSLSFYHVLHGMK